MKTHLKNILYRGIQSKRGVRTLEDGIARVEPREENREEGGNYLLGVFLPVANTLGGFNQVRILRFSSQQLFCERKEIYTPI